MPLYDTEHLHAIWLTAHSRWWRVFRWCTQTTLVLWLVTRFIDSSPISHISTCLAIILIAEGRLRHHRNVMYQEAFGVGTWEALRALHERLDEVNPPTDSQRSDSHTNVSASPFEPGANATWTKRIAMPLEPFGTDLVDVASRRRHWGTTFLRREIGNIRMAQKHAQRVGQGGLPTAQLEDGEKTALFHKALASLALLWAMLAEPSQLPTRVHYMGLLVGAALAAIVALEFTKYVVDCRSHSRTVLEARNRGVEAAIIAFRSEDHRSSRTVRVGHATIRLDFMGRTVTVRDGERVVFEGVLNAARSKLRKIDILAPGDWVDRLKAGRAE